MSGVALAYRKAGPFLSMGSVLAGSVAAGCFGGWWLDQQFDTKPWLFLAGALLGMVSGFYQFIRTLNRLNS